MRVLDYNLGSIGFESQRASLTAIIYSKYGFCTELVNMKSKQDMVSLTRLTLYLAEITISNHMFLKTLLSLSNWIFQFRGRTSFTKIYKEARGDARWIQWRQFFRSSLTSYPMMNFFNVWSAATASIKYDLFHSWTGYAHAICPTCPPVEPLWYSVPLAHCASEAWPFADKW